MFMLLIVFKRVLADFFKTTQILKTSWVGHDSEDQVLLAVSLHQVKSTK